MLLRIDVYPHSAIAAAAAAASNDNEQEQEQEPPPPLYANLRTSSHHHHKSSSSTDNNNNNNGILMTVGRKNCDVTFETDKCVSRSHCRLRLVSIHAKQEKEEEEEEDENGMPKACFPRNAKEKDACKETEDGWIVVLEDLGSKFGTYILVDAPDETNKKESTKKADNNNNNDDDDDETDDEEMVENSLSHQNSQLSAQSVPITIQMYQASLLLGGNPPPPPSTMNDEENTAAQVKRILKKKGQALTARKKQIVQKIETKQSAILTPLNHNQSIVLLCGQSGSILKITRIPLHFTLSRLTSSVKSQLQEMSPFIGATIHSTWVHQYSTHLITPTATTTAKHLTAWCCKCPIVTPDYVEALYKRISLEDDLPNVQKYKSPGDTPMDDDAEEEKVDGDGATTMVDIMKHYTILSLTENDEMVPLVQAAGCANVVPCFSSSYADTATFTQFLSDTIEASAAKKLKVVFVESKSRKCKKQRSVLWKRMEEQKDVWCVQPKDVASAVSSFGKNKRGNGSGGGGVLLDVHGEEITPLVDDDDKKNVQQKEDIDDENAVVNEEEDIIEDIPNDKDDIDKDDINSDGESSRPTVHLIEDDEKATGSKSLKNTSPRRKRRLPDIQEEEEGDDESSPEGRHQKRTKSSPDENDDIEERTTSKALASAQRKETRTRKRTMENEDQEEEKEVMANNDDDNATAISTSTRKGKKKKTGNSGGWMSSSRRNTNDNTSHKPSLMTIKKDEDDERDNDNDGDHHFAAPPSPTSSAHHRRPHLIKSSSSSPPKWKKILSKSKDGWYNTAPTGKIRTEQRIIAAAHWEKEMNEDHDFNNSSANIVPMSDAAETEQRGDLIVRSEEEVSIWRHKMQQQQQQRKMRQKGKKGGKDVPDFKHFRKNRIIPGTSWCLGDDEDYDADANDDPNASTIRLRSVLPKESERQRQLEVSQRELERERLAADALFADHKGGRGGGGGGNIRDFFRQQQKTKRTGAGSVASSRRGPRGGSRR